MAHAHAQHDEHAPNVKLYMAVFAALMVLTVVTVWISKFHLSIGAAIALGMLVASVKAALVAAVFMHLWGEKRLVFYILGLTVFLGAGLIVALIDSNWVQHGTTMPVNVKEQKPEHGAHEESPMEKTAPNKPKAKTSGGREGTHGSH